MGPTGPDAAAGDRFVHARLCSLGVGDEVIGWLEEYFDNGLPTVEVSDLYMPADGSFLRASTYGRGVWDLQLR